MEPEAACCPHCGQKQLLDSYPDSDERGRKGQWKQDTEHCHYCKKRYQLASDKYCRYCGKRRSKKPVKYFVVSPDYMECVYGPMPVALSYQCRKCGNQWEGSNWNSQNYCPQCGWEVQGIEKIEERPPVIPYGETIDVLSRNSVDKTIGTGFVLIAPYGNIIVVPDDGCIIGRNAKGGGFLKENTISREHFRIKPKSDTSVEIVDCSRNGTYIDGDRIAVTDCMR